MRLLTGSQKTNSAKQYYRIIRLCIRAGAEVAIGRKVDGLNSLGSFSECGAHVEGA